MKASHLLNLLILTLWSPPLAYAVFTEGNGRRFYPQKPQNLFKNIAFGIKKEEPIFGQPKKVSNLINKNELQQEWEALTWPETSSLPLRHSTIFPPFGKLTALKAKIKELILGNVEDILNGVAGRSAEIDRIRRIIGLKPKARSSHHRLLQSVAMVGEHCLYDEQCPEGAICYKSPMNIQQKPPDYRYCVCKVGKPIIRSDHVQYCPDSLREEPPKRPDYSSFTTKTPKTRRPSSGSATTSAFNLDALFAFWQQNHTVSTSVTSGNMEEWMDPEMIPSVEFVTAVPTIHRGWQAVRNGFRFTRLSTTTSPPPTTTTTTTPTTTSTATTTTPSPQPPRWTTRKKSNFGVASADTDWTFSFPFRIITRPTRWPMAAVSARTTSPAVTTDSLSDEKKWCSGVETAAALRILIEDFKLLLDKLNLKKVWSSIQE